MKSPWEEPIMQVLQVNTNTQDGVVIGGADLGIFDS
jgi:hypothetical protein